MVEEAANTNRIAQREMKVKVGSALKDEEIAWAMDAGFTPEGQSQPSIIKAVVIIVVGILAASGLLWLLGWDRS